MPRVFFIADTHFDDEGIIAYEGRPFDSVDEMNEELVRRWNDVVGDDDLVYHLGDVGLAGRECEPLSRIVSRLSGRIVLVRGNHDGEDDDTYREMGFAEVNNHPIIIDGFWILSHEPMYVSTRSPYVNVFGHIHGNPMYRTVSSHSYCVSAERTGYAPIPFDEIKRAIGECREGTDGRADGRREAG